MSVLVSRQIKEEIERATRILLLTDERIDGDTMGSTLGMYHVLVALGKDVTVFSPQPLHSTLAFLPGANVVRRDTELFDGGEFDFAMIFDCSDGKYFVPLLKKLKRPVKLAVFDHHATNPLYGQLNLVEKTAASSADVVWRFLKRAGYPVNQDAAQCILTGICTDTVVFSTTNTTVACLEAAQELSKLGAKMPEIVRHTMMNRTIPSLKLWGVGFERLHENKQFDAVTTVIKQKDLKELGADQEDIQGLSGFLHAMLEGADTVLVMYEREDGSVKGSLRSRTKDVAQLAMRYGGGGHIRAAGFLVAGATLEEKDGQWVIRRVGGEIVVG